MSIEQVHDKLRTYFAEKLEQHGPTPGAADYNSLEAQQIRFAELVKVIDPSRPFTVIDYGSGYGAMFDFLHERGWQFDYYGFDSIERMVAVGRETHSSFPNAHFTTDEADLPVTDYLVAGAIFNIKLDAPREEWQEYILRTLRKMDRRCTRGFSFNMLTRYSEEQRMAERPDLFYGDPALFFDFCKREMSKNVALLHDYGLYDFTILVRKDR